MRKPFYGIYLLLIVAGSFFGGAWYAKREPGGTAQAAGRRILYYHDPMHPTYKSDKPGIAPDCGMQLEPVYADEAPENQAISLPPGTVQVSEQGKRLLGVRLAPAARMAASHTLRTVGRVTPDENRIHRVLMGTDGWIREIHGGYTGSMVRKDQLLASAYNREFLTAELALLYALNAMDRFKKEGMDSSEQVAATNAQIVSAEDNLHSLGMGDIQIQELSKTRKLTRDVAVRAPTTGLVLARNVFPGLRFERGAELYRLVDLSLVWILADLFENEAQYFRPGAVARVTIPHQQKTVTARVTADPPQFDPASRTLKVRLEADNPGGVLRPEMFVDVELPVRLPSAVMVLADSVIDSGLKKTVYVERGNDTFEPRQVETGWRSGDHVAITKGLEPGERVVVSGTFLVDSESRMKLAAAAGPKAAAMHTEKDPVCGMHADPDKALKSDYRGRTYYFCSEGCKREFEKNPERFLQKKAVSESHKPEAAS